MKNMPLLTFCLLGAPVLSSCALSPKTDHKPNILLILADDMGWGDVNVNGNNIIETPALNRLVNESMSFDRFYVCPLSAPTRSQMLTGRYFLRTGVSSVTRGYENMRTDETTIAEVLEENDYSTGCFGKWHNGGYFQQHPNRQGFDEYIGFCVGHLGYYFDATYMHNDDEIKSAGYSTDFFTNQALDFVDNNNDKPFFCYVSYNVPHSPFQVPEKYFLKYKEKGLNDELSAIYGMVENMDENIDKLLNKLEQLKIRDNTIVLFLSDNGPNTYRYNGDMKGRKGSVDEGGVRVPFYISWPDVINVGTTTQLAQDIDIFPTLLKLCDLNYKVEKPLDGIDLSGVMTRNEKSFERYIFSRQANASLDICNGSVRNDRYRLVRTKKDTLLYDLVNDPSQKTDISSGSRKPFLELSTLLGQWEDELVSNYLPVTTIEAGFPEEKKFTLPVQDATLSGGIKYSSIHPNQSHTENWQQNGDSIFWTLNINTGGTYKVEMQYGCTNSDTGSKMAFYSESESVFFSIDIPFESEILPELDYVKRSESVERTWSWMDIGNVTLEPGPEKLVVKLLKKKGTEAGLVKAIRLVKI